MSMPPIKTIGVIGAGRMGSGIAQVCARAGYDVVVSDISEEATNTLLTRVARNLDRQVWNGTLSGADQIATVSRITTGTDPSVFAGADFVIEAATEDETLKRNILRALAPHLKPEALIATNTSSIPITRLAAATDRPAKFIGMHFMNPVPAMPLVELIRGIATDPATFDSARHLAESIGKTVAVAEDFPAFIVNRVLMSMINEAVYTLYEGVGTIRDIDRALTLGANHPMGPLELADFIGLDTCCAIMQSLRTSLTSSKHRPCPLLVKYVEAGWTGRKAGRGFYDYTHNPPLPSR